MFLSDEGFEFVAQDLNPPVRVRVSNVLNESLEFSLLGGTRLASRQDLNDAFFNIVINVHMARRPPQRASSLRLQTHTRAQKRQRAAKNQIKNENSVVSKGWKLNLKNRPCELR